MHNKFSAISAPKIDFLGLFRFGTLISGVPFRRSVSSSSSRAGIRKAEIHNWCLRSVAQASWPQWQAKAHGRLQHRRAVVYRERRQYPAVRV